jgi:hypothetical protein
MRRLLYVATLVALALPPVSWAQRSGMHGGSFSGHGSFSSRGAARTSAPAHFGGARSSVRFQTSFHPPFRTPTSGVRIHIRTSSFYPYRYYSYPYLYGAYYNPFLWDWYNSSQGSSQDDYAAQQTGRQIDELSQQVQELREEREYRQAATSSSSVPRPPLREEARTDTDLPVVLVFLDKRIQEVKNYAIANEMLLVFDDHRTKKIPLADIDLAATMKLNDERGVDFEVPSPTASE